MNTKPRGYKIWEDRDYVAIATMQTTNRKTGDMVQVWILNRDVSPGDSVASGLDATTNCRGCVFASGKGCYVDVNKAPRAVWLAWQRGVYPAMRDFGIFRGRKVRFGAYGNPSLIPLDVIYTITQFASGHTGYFHDWQLMTPRMARAYGRYFMASTDSEDSRLAAMALGLRYFHVSPVQPAETRECLATSRGLDCASCLLCSGSAKTTQASIWIDPHGKGRNKAITAGGNYELSK